MSPLLLNCLGSLVCSPVTLSYRDNNRDKAALASFRSGTAAGGDTAQATDSATSAAGVESVTADSERVIATVVDEVCSRVAAVVDVSANALFKTQPAAATPAAASLPPLRRRKRSKSPPPPATSTGAFPYNP